MCRVLVLKSVKILSNRPMITAVLKIANNRPRALLSHPSEIVLIRPDISFAQRLKSRTVTTMTITKDSTYSTEGETLMY